MFDALKRLADPRSRKGNRSASCSRICTGSTRKPRRSWTCCWRASPQQGCWCWSITARSMKLAGPRRATFRKCGSIRSRQRAPTNCSRCCWAPTRSSTRSSKGLIEATEGNPLFLEESVRSLIESGALDQSSGQWRLVGPLPADFVPRTIEALLAERIDRLRPDLKEILQCASVIGNDIRESLLEAVTGIAQSDLGTQRAGLAGRRVPVREIAFPGDGICVQALDDARGCIRELAARTKNGAACARRPRARGARGGTPR